MKREYVKYILCLLLFGSNGIVASRIALSSYEIVYLKTGIGFLLLLLLFLLGRQKWQIKRHPKEMVYVALSGIATGFCNIFLYEAYQQIGVSISSLLYYCGPVIVMALAPICFREKLIPAKCLGLGAVLLGLVLINGFAAQEGKAPFGLFCGMMAAVMYAIMVISIKKTVYIAGMEKVCFQTLFSFLTVAGFLFFRQGLTVVVPAGSWQPILLLGLVNTGIGCYLYFSSIGRLPVQTVAVCGYLEPLSAVVLSAVLLGEAMGGLQLVGGVLILGGALFAELSGKRVLDEKKAPKIANGI